MHVDNFESVKDKAHKINLDSLYYGSFAEIGAGQEVTRHFFRAGAASRTVAKAMSAYDMKFSDEIYGKEGNGRYVCESRLNKMLEHEYNILIERLEIQRGSSTCFFSLANTLTTTNFADDFAGHGWMGVRFQKKPGGPYNQVTIHLKMLDRQGVDQQEVVGVLGVNLLYALFYHDDLDTFPQQLVEGIHRQRLEIDYIRFEGPHFEDVDNRLMNFLLVKNGMTNAVLFQENGDVILARDYLYHRNLLVVRGSYHPPTLVSEDILSSGRECFAKDIQNEDIETLCEITLVNQQNQMIQEEDFLFRLKLVSSLGKKLLLTNYPEYHNLTSYFYDLKPFNIAIVLGVYNFQQIFSQEYKHPKGGILESLGLLFRDNVRIYLYPYRNFKDDELTELENLQTPKEFSFLMEYLKGNNQLKGIKNYNNKILHIYSSLILNLIKEKNALWHTMVSGKVKKLLEQKFGNE